MPFFNLGGGGSGGDGGLPVLTGSGAPGASLGVDGQIYIDSLNERLYGPKTAGSWGSGYGFGSGDYTELVNVPTEFTPAAHAHTIADVTGLQAELDQFVTSAEVTAQVTGIADNAPETLNTLQELAAALGDDPNFATTITTQIAAKADAVHVHAISDVTGLQTALDGKQAAGSYAAATHDHTKSEITDLGTTDLDLGGNKCLFSNYFPTVSDFPSATTYHGGVAHSHETGALYFAHAGAWEQLANYSDLPLDAISWSSVPASETAAGTAGEVAYDTESLYVCVSDSLWKKVPLLDFSAGGGGGSYSITITSQPASGSASNGAFALSVSAYIPTGETISYQWETSTDGTNWSDLSGATSASYVVTGLTTADSGTQYRCRLSSSGFDTVYSQAATVTVASSGVDGVTVSAPSILSLGGSLPQSFQIQTDNISLGSSGWSIVLKEYQYGLSWTHNLDFPYESGATTQTYSTALPLAPGAYGTGLNVGNNYDTYPGNGGWLPSMRARARYRLERTVNGQPEQTQTDWTAWGVARTGSENLVLSDTPTNFTTQPQGGTVNLRTNYNAQVFSTSAEVEGTAKRYWWRGASTGDSIGPSLDVFQKNYSIAQPVHVSEVGTRYASCVGAADYLRGSLSNQIEILTQFSTLPDEKRLATDNISCFAIFNYQYGIELSPKIYILGLETLLDQPVDDLFTSGKLEYIIEYNTSYGSSESQWYSWQSPIVNVYNSSGLITQYSSQNYTSGRTYRACVRLREATISFEGQTYNDVWTVFSNWVYVNTF